jgi:hypothetical protein
LAIAETTQNRSEFIFAEEAVIALQMTM